MRIEELGYGLAGGGICCILHIRRRENGRKTDDLPMTKELGLRSRSLRAPVRLTQSELVRRFAALHSRGEPSVPAQLALDGLDRHLRRK